METLEDYIEKLGGWLRSTGVPDWERVLIAEDLTISPFSKQSVNDSELHSLEDYSSRFAELLNEGHNWINLCGLGILDGTLIVAVEKPRANAGSPTTSVNQSGPPNCVKDNNYRLDPFIELTDE